MDKLTQFVSKSFDNNNSVLCVDNDSRSLKLSPENLVKNETESILATEQKHDDETEEEKAKPVAKNWLIPDSPKCSPPTYGIDLSLNSSFNSSIISEQNLKKFQTATVKNSPPSPMIRWFEHNSEVKTPSPKNGYTSSASSPIDLEDSKSCPETLTNSDGVNAETDPQDQQSATGNSKKRSPTVDTDKKICE